jgi:hypothetical protein
MGKQTTLIQSNTRQVYLYSFVYLYMYATWLARYLGYPQACHYKTVYRKIQ